MSVPLGAVYLGQGRCSFSVWAPLCARVDVHLLPPQERILQLEARDSGYHQAILSDVEPGSRYVYRFDEIKELKERPDPASRFQPEGVHGPSEVIDPNFLWTDGGWCGRPLADYIIYEVHVGTFTPEGTFDGIISCLDDLNALGITAIELMPLAQFPGNRNWGYDGVFPFAVQESYGGPAGLKRLVNACHGHGLAVVLDVAYNHLGPEGNYLCDFAPYFTDRYKTPWGAAVNFDGADSQEVRRFFIENALYWIGEFHIDALRLDATHAIYDFSARPFLEELAHDVHRHAEGLNRRSYLIAESDRNDVRLIRSPEVGGYALDAQWNDDFHHALHGLLTGERSGYYQDFGGIEQLIKAFREGFVYSGEFSKYRRRPHGSSSRDVAASQLVVFAQNHDQVGNRMWGERLSLLLPFEALKLAAGVVLLSPFVPLLFMGEDYGETAPFQYFVSHSDPKLVEAVRRGRSEEFAAFGWKGEVPDPPAESTFQRSKLNCVLRQEGQHRILYDFHTELIRLRKSLPALASLSKERMEVIGFGTQKVMCVRRWSDDQQVASIFNFEAAPASVELPWLVGRWRTLLDSADRRWGGPGKAAQSEARSSGGSALLLNEKSFALFAGED